MNSATPPKMLERMLDALDVPIYTFGADRKVIYANIIAQEKLGLTAPNAPVGAGELNHFEDNKYYDEAGNHLPYPKGSAVEQALRGIPTHNLLIEHRNTKEYYQEWLQVSCIPVMEHGAFSYGILWYRDVTARKKREDKLTFLVESSKILSVTTEFEERLHQKARIVVPSLADWCAIDIVSGGSIKRIATVHRDPAKMEWLAAYRQKYPDPPKEASLVERVVRTGKTEFMPVVTQDMVDQTPHLSAEQREDIKSLELSSIIVLPIGTQGRVLGTLTLAYAESNRVYTPDDVTFFTEFSHHLSVLLENARLYEEIKERDLAKDAFLASLSHELRNPIAPIKSAVELLRLKNTNPALEVEIETIEHQFDHLAHLLNDLLDSTRFVRGKIKLDIQSVELTAILKQVARAAEAAAHRAGLTVDMHYPTQPLWVMVDSTRLEQALTNIVHNAIKFTPEGGSITIRTAHTDTQVDIYIKDTGAGITEDEMEQIFNPYYQSDRVRTANTGLGIGLQLVHQIVQLLGGTINVHSPGIDQGSEFCITLALAKEQEQSATHFLPSVVASKKVVVVDDNPAASDGLVRLLQALGWQAQGLYSGHEALEYLTNPEHVVDVLFLDVGMPGMSGYEVVSQLRAKGYTLPVIALTGYGMREDKERAFHAGFTAHLTKPIGTKELLEIFAEIDQYAYNQHESNSASNTTN